MNLFSLYVPGNSLFHRLAPGWKYLILLAITLPGLILGDPVVSLALLAASMAVLLSCRTPAPLTLSLPTALWVMLAVVCGYQVVVGRPDLAVVVGANLVTAIYASRLLTLTTPGPVLIDALIGLLRPLRRLGLNTEQVGLAIAIMVRSVPLLLDSFDQVRQAARARGRERHLFALVAPVVVRAVGQAQDVGAALAARGLAES